MRVSSAGAWIPWRPPDPMDPLTDPLKNSVVMSTWSRLPHQEIKRSTIYIHPLTRGCFSKTKIVDKCSQRDYRSGSKFKLKYLNRVGAILSDPL